MDENLYTLLKQTAGFRKVNHPAYLRLTGESRLDFLNRQSTNDLKRLAPSVAQITVLTSPTARILDVLIVFQEDGLHEPALGVLGLPGLSSQTTRFLKSRIFFMDKVTVEDVSQQFCQFEVFGPTAGPLLHNLGLAGSLPYQVSTLEGIRLQVFCPPGLLSAATRLVAPVSMAPHLQDHLIRSGFIPVSDEMYEILRIEPGIPAVQSELNDSYTPLEMNLHEYISGNKGCYTGQEIIARQLTYDKVIRSLTGLTTKSLVKSGNPVFFEGKNIGEVTSSAVSPQLGFIALAVLKRPFFAAGTQVNVGNDNQIVPAKVAALPFPH